MGILDHRKITLKKKKIVFIILFFNLLIFVPNICMAQEEPCNIFCTETALYKINSDNSDFQYLCRRIGKVNNSDLCDVCVPQIQTEGTTVTKYNCVCQNENEVINCYVGGLFRGNRMAVCLCCGDCNPNDLLYIGVSIAETILEYLGAIALALFVLGGIMWITSGGSKDRVQKGVAIIKGAITGIIIVIVAYSAIKLAMKALDIESKYLPEYQSSSQEHKIS